MDAEDGNRLDTWANDMEGIDSRDIMSMVGAVLAYRLEVYSDRKSLWRRAAELGKSLDAILTRAIYHCPQAEVLWSMSVKEKLEGNVLAACEAPGRALIANLESEQIWLAAARLEAGNGKPKVAQLLMQARTVVDTE
ncbi:hypothetical protein BD779DRAFT_1682090 [Infundibulicybe gibba]|nr:hypothetical protein BD779DRAFT_1682090 [Infundibulicybe gibba]